MGEVIPFDRRLAVPAHVASRDLDGELVLLNYDSETYFGLDAVGTRILEVLQSSRTIEDGFGLLLEEFDVGAEQLRADVQQLLTELVDSGLVELQAV